MRLKKCSQQVSGWHHRGYVYCHAVLFKKHSFDINSCCRKQSGHFTAHVFLTFDQAEFTQKRRSSGLRLEGVPCMILMFWPCDDRSIHKKLQIEISPVELLGRCYWSVLIGWNVEQKLTDYRRGKGQSQRPKKMKSEEEARNKVGHVKRKMRREKSEEGEEMYRMKGGN